MADNLAEKVDGYPLNRGRSVPFAYSWDCENCPLYGVAGCPLFRGCLRSEWKDNRDFQIYCRCLLLRGAC